MNKYIEAHSGDFAGAVDFFQKEIANLRTGRANPGILEGIMVDSYGLKTPLNGLASVNVPDGQSILVTPWDKNNLREIEKAIIEAELGLGTVNEGEKIRLTVPKMTEENRLQIVKKLNEKQEQTKISIRQTREAIKNKIETAEKTKEISEDDKYIFLKELDEEASRQNGLLKILRDKKEAEIMTI